MEKFVQRLWKGGEIMIRCEKRLVDGAKTSLWTSAGAKTSDKQTLIEFLGNGQQTIIEKAL